MGDVRNASDFFERANTILAQSKNLLCNERKIFTSKARINDGLIYLAVDDFPAAIASFDEVRVRVNVRCLSYTFDTSKNTVEYSNSFSSSFECNRHWMN